VDTDDRQHMRSAAKVSKLVLIVAVCGLRASAAASAHAVVDPNWDASRPRGITRTVDFSVDEGTGMSIDLSPDGRTVVFDLLGHVYSMPASGGVARCLTQDSGIALNFHPRFSPDGRHVAFVSDRSGQNSLWIANADGSNPRQIFLDRDTRIAEPAWSEDGRRIAAVRGFPTPGRGYHRVNTQVWEFTVETGAARVLLSDPNLQYNSPAYSADGKSLYSHASYFSGNRYGTQVGHHLRRLDLSSGTITGIGDAANAVSRKQAADFQVVRPEDIPDDMAAEISPVPSPDGRLLAFAREVQDKAFEYRGHKLAPRTALVVRDLSTGAERVVMDPITKDLSSTHAMYSYRVLPGFAWTKDSNAIVLTEGGKLRRLDVSSRAVATIPFEARVHRVISEQVRGHVDIEDREFTVKFLQWPRSSPDGKRLLFVAVGRVWVVDLPGGIPQSLVDIPDAGFQLTPSWSADGRTIVFATWDDRKRGEIWRVGADGKSLAKLTSKSGEYLYPQLSADARIVVFAEGPGPLSRWNGWESEGSWRISTLMIAGGAVTPLVETKRPREPWLQHDGRVYFEFQENPAAAAGLYQPYPSQEALAQRVELQSVHLDGSDRRAHVAFPASWVAFAGGNRPSISPDGKWIAFQAAQSVYVTPFQEMPAGAAVRLIDPDPNVARADVVRVGEDGGAYHRWREAQVLEFVTGNDYVTYDVRSRKRTVVPIDLRVPRNVPTGSIALTHARVVTMEKDHILEDAAIVVDGGRIACVGACDTSHAQRVLDVRGKTIIPGLFDVHAHNSIELSDVIPAHRPDSAAYLAYGVTTTLDPQAMSTSSFPVAEMTEAGLIRGPRIFSTGELLVSKGAAFGNVLEIQSFEDAVHHVSRRAKWGAIAIKNFRQSRRDQTQKVVEAARLGRVTVTGEGGPLYFDIGLAMDGQTGWEHYIADLPIYRDVSTFLGQAGVTYSPTALVAGHGMGSVEYFRPRTNLLDDEKYLRFMPRADVVAATQRQKTLPLDVFSFPIIAEGLKDVIRAGGHGAIGEHAEQRGIGSIWEAFGYGVALTPKETLRVASLDAARFHGLDHAIGSIRPGKIADLVILDSDPAQDLRNLLTIRLVMKAGNLYDATTLDQLWPREDRFGPMPWLSGAPDTAERAGEERHEEN
jgi:Tol biopolymer transport system component